MSTPPNPPLILASASPRRRELLRYLGVEYSVLATQGEDEDRPLPAALRAQLPAAPVDPATHPTMLAWRKCDAAAEQTTGLILGADTIVVLDDEVLGKPRDPAHANAMLARLAGRTHTVYTGVCLFDTTTGRTALALDSAAVTMTPLDAATISAYVATGEPMDKAGSYGIQGLGGRLVTDVRGSFSCVIGLPLGAVYALLAGIGYYTQLVEPQTAFDRWRAEHGKDGPPCTAP